MTPLELQARVEQLERERDLSPEYKASLRIRVLEDQLAAATQRAEKAERERDEAREAAAVNNTRASVSERREKLRQSENAALREQLRVAREAWKILRPFLPLKGSGPQWEQSEHYRAARNVDAALAATEERGQCIPDICGLCGLPAAGWAMADGKRLCHPDGTARPDCYTLWTRGKKRPAATEEKA